MTRQDKKRYMPLMKVHRMLTENKKRSSLNNLLLQSFIHLPFEKDRDTDNPEH